nr:hypothetical protein [Tanacetum cinerariifolium]
MAHHINNTNNNDDNNNNDNTNLPLTPLYHVRPTNRFDLLHFLHSFVNDGLTPVHQGIRQLNLYATIPNNLIDNHRHGEDYFVLTPKQLNAAGTEFMTITDDGLGEWEVVDEPEQAPNQNQPIGFRATYNLEYDDGYDGD